MSGKPFPALKGSPAPLWRRRLESTHLAFSPDGTFLLAGGFAGLTALDARDGQPLGPSLAGGVEVRGLQFCADGSCFLAYAANWAGLWKTADLKPVWFETGVRHWGALSPCGTLAAFAIPGKKTLLRVRSAQREASRELPFSARPRGVTYWQGGFAFACEDGLWWMEPNGQVRQLLSGCCMDVASGGQSELWVLETGHLRSYPQGPRLACGPALSHLTVDGRGHLLATTATGARPYGRIWVLQGAEMIEPDLQGAALCPAGKRVAISGGKGPLKLCDASNGELQKEIATAGRCPVWGSEQLLATGGSEIALWPV